MDSYRIFQEESAILKGMIEDTFRITKIGIIIFGWFFVCF